MGNAIRVELLGEFAVFSGGTRVVLPTRKTRALAAYLALNAGKRLGRSMLCDLLADNLLRTALQRGHWSSRVKLLSKDGHACYQTRTVQPLFDRHGLMIGAFGTGVSV